ncbi:MAG: TatD DNase family protein [Hyphomicrobiaceae bacterium]
MSSGPGLVDSHCHILDKRFADDRDAVIQRARDAGVHRIVAVGGGGPIEDSEESARLAAQHDFIAATAGIHPHDADSYDDAIESRIVALLESNAIAAVGETGLDYFYEHSPRPAQRNALARHLGLAKRFDKPVVLHCRESEADLHEVLASETPDGIRGVVHCFTGGYDDARRYLDHGLLISFTGMITFKNADELRDTARRLPLDRMMVETDSPYLAPMPYRGKRNEPAYVVKVAAALAELHGVSLARVEEATTANAEALFFS